MLSTFKIKFYYSKIFISVFCAILFFAVIPSMAKAAIVNVHGWAWSDTIGWIQFDTGKSSLPTYDTATGALSGYAWSDNIGWIYLGPDIAGKVTASSAPENPKQWAKANTGSGMVSGWARAYRAIPDKNDINAEDSQTLGSWDGWIKFDTGRSNSVKIDFATGDFHGYAWGSDVVGWISFNCLEGSSGAGSVCGTSNYKVYIPPPGGVTANKDLNVTINTPNCGTGTVVSNPPGINCLGDCFQQYPTGQQVTLTATQTNGSVFTGWTGVTGCNGLGSCTITMNNNTNVVANFSKSDCTGISPSSSSSSSSGGNSSTANLSVIYAGSGTGSVSLQHMGSLDGNDNGFDTSISGSAPWDLAPNWTFKITAAPGANSSFGGWSVSSGSCDTSQGVNTCILTMDADKIVTVTFNCVSNCAGGGGGGGNTLTVDVGNGTVTVVAIDGSSPTLTCSNFANCSQSYAVGTKLTLTESETGGEPFDRWTGDCSVSGGASTCNLTMDSSRLVGALFGGCACAGNSCTPCTPPPPSVPPINGACGTAHKTNGKEAPSVNLCADGSNPPVSGTGPWTWTCLGSNGGTDASCSAGKLEVIIQEI